MRNAQLKSIPHYALRITHCSSGGVSFGLNFKLFDSDFDDDGRNIRRKSILGLEKKSDTALGLERIGGGKSTILARELRQGDG